MKYCTNCGNELLSKFEHCNKCGTPVFNNTSPAVTNETQNFMSPSKQTHTNPHNKKHLNKKIFIPICLILIIIILIIILSSTCNHDWTESTCTSPKACLLCGDTEGEALEHNVSENNEWNIDYDKAVNIKELTCSRCEEVVETQEEPITTFIERKCFTIYPYAFANRFEESSSRLKNIDYSTKSEYTYDMPTYDEENYLYYRIQDKNDDYSDVGLISFTKPNGNTISAMDDFSEDSFDSMNILIENASDVSAVVYTTILAIDPAIDYDEAAKVGQAIVDDVQDLRLVDDDYIDSIDKNSISYALCKDRNYHYLLVSIASN